MKKTIITLLAITLVITTLISQTPTNETKPKTTTPSFFDLYEQNRKKQIPNYISLDFILTANYLFKQQSVTQMEEGILYSKFKNLAFKLNDNMLKNYKKEKKEALAYLIVLNDLLGNHSQNLPSEALALAQQELKLIKAHKGIVSSPIAKVKLDYTQYKVRGKYVKNNELKSYFLALKYMGYMPFMVNANPATGVSKKVAKEQIENALFVAEALKPLTKEYQIIENILQQLSGKGDDLSLLVLSNQSKDIAKVQKHLNGLNQFPKISERIIDTSKIDKKDIPKASLALKLLPSRFTPDSYIFSQLTYPNVGKLQGKRNKLTSVIDGKSVRGYPSVMDIAEVVGKKSFKTFTNYQGYKKQVKKLKTIKLTMSSLYGYDFAIYKKLIEKGKTNSFKGYYTQSRYILNLYQKQSYTGGLKSIFFDERKKAYLEKNIGGVLDLLIKEDRLLANSKGFIDILKTLKALDKKQNKFKPKDIAFLNNLDSKFKSVLEDKDSKIEVDIHTNPVDGKAMYEVLDEPFVRDINGFRGAFYNHREVVKGR